MSAGTTGSAPAGSAQTSSASIAAKGAAHFGNRLDGFLSMRKGRGQLGEGDYAVVAVLLPGGNNFQRRTQNFSIPARLPSPTNARGALTDKAFPSVRHGGMEVASISGSFPGKSKDPLHDRLRTPIALPLPFHRADRK